MDSVRQLVRKVQLGRKLKVSPGDRSGANFKVNMHGSDRIPTRINREKLCFALGISHLVPTQKLMAKCVEAWVFHIRIDTLGIALPDVD